MLALAMVLALGAAGPVLAQDRKTDAELEALIPDAAMDDAEGWVREGAPPAVPEPPAASENPATAQGAAAPEPPFAQAAPAFQPDAAGPIVEEGFTLPWPGDEPVESAALAPLEPEPDLAETAEQQPVSLAAAGDATRVSRRVTLVWPANFGDFPERAEFERRFRELSAIEQLSGKGDGGLAQLAVRARTDNLLLARMLRVYGFYDADVSQVIGGIEPGQEQATAEPGVRFEILPGERYRFGAIDLGLIAAAGPDEPGLRAAFGIATGDPLSSDRIVSARGKLDEALGEAGFAFARINEPDLTIDHRRVAGDLAMGVMPGGKYAFGPITSNHERFMSARHLQEIARFGPGDPWKRSTVDDLRRAIIATGLVSSVNVSLRETRAPAAGQPGEVALDVNMEKAPLRTIAGAAGYDSGEGFRLEASWEHRNLFPPEGMLRVRGVLGTKEQLAGATFRRNNFLKRDQVLTIDAFGQRTHNDAYLARTVALTGGIERRTTLIFQRPWVWGVGLEALFSQEKLVKSKLGKSSRFDYYVAAAPMHLAYDGSDSLLDPSRGFRAALRVSPEYSVQEKVHTQYVKAQFDASAYQPIGSSIVIAGRARFGSTLGAANRYIAPSRRFYAGGGGSVRGYDYKAIGPVDASGAFTGGRALSEFSLEARVNTGLFGGAVSVVPFVDAGAVDQGPMPRMKDLRFGAGVGLRYKTAFGPIRIDLGTPIGRRKGENLLGVYVALGQAF